MVAPITLYVLATMLATVASVGSAALHEVVVGPYIRKFDILQCPQTAQEIAFYVSAANPAFAGATPRPIRYFDFSDDASASAGKKIMAAFTATDGTVVTDEEGFDPCTQHTCAGVSCRQPGTFVVLQEYNSLADYAAGGLPLSFPNYLASSSTFEDRCKCVYRDNFTQSQVGTLFYNNYTIDPASLSAERSSANCSGLVCDPNPTVDILYYLWLASGSEDSCQCCRKQLTLAPKQDDATCNAVAPQESPSPIPSTSAPDYVLPNSFADLVVNVCPAETTASIPPEVLTANSDAFCCYFESSTVTPERYCGVDLLSVRGPGKLTCVSRIPNQTFECCAVVNAVGAVATQGRYCDGVLQRGPDSTVVSASPPVLALLAVILASIFVAL